MNDDSILQLKLLGKGGQGLLLLSKTIGKILTEQLNYNVSIKTAYDSAVRRGEVDIDLIASADRISNPVIDKADLSIILRDYSELPDSELYVVEKSITNNFLKKSKENSHLIDFIKVSEENSLKDELNMIILGWLIKKLDIGLNIENIEKYLPKINKESNFEAVKVGFNL